MEETLRKRLKAIVLPRVIEQWDREADVIMVGFGGAGAAAAIEAHDAGAEVLIMEKTAAPGGTTRISAGGIYCNSTSLQKELGIEDSPEAAYKYLMAVASFEGKLSADPELTKIIAYQGSEIFEWCKGLGMSFPARLWQAPPYFHKSRAPGLTMTGCERYPEFAAITPPTYRSHWCDGLGFALFGALETAVNQRKIKCLFNTSARSLIVGSNGTVQGVLAEGDSGKLYIKSKKAVVLAAGGHGYNKWVATGLPRSQACLESPYRTIPFSNTGDGIMMGLALGADFWANDGADATPVGFIPATSAFADIWSKPRVFVNKQGRRYVNEEWYFSMQAAYLGKQEDMVGWAIIDDKVVAKLGREIINERVRVGSKVRAESFVGHIVKADSVDELVKAIEVNRANLKETIATWNANAAKGYDPEWHREWGLEPIDTPPFYATRVVLNEGCEGTGLKINTRAQVINVAGKPIARLYAAGRTSGGQFGIYPGCGSSIASCLMFGRIAGKNSAKEPREL